MAGHFPSPSGLLCSEPSQVYGGVLLTQSPTFINSISLGLLPSINPKNGQVAGNFPFPLGLLCSEPS